MSNRPTVCEVETTEDTLSKQMSLQMSVNVKLFECEQIADDKLLFAVIASRCNGKWVFCRHKERDTYEIPGGRREKGENIDDTARRELTEETGVLSFDIIPVCVY